jgi:hypothetical protein
MYKTILIIFFSAAAAFSQGMKSYYIAAEGSIGISRFLSTLNMEGLNKNGFSSSLTIYWHPEHLLEAGIETGYQYLYSYKDENKVTEYGITSASASLVSLPFIIVFRMRVLDNFKIHAGSGIILLFSSGEAFNDKFSSSQASIVDYIGLSYNYPFSDKVYLGGSFKYNYIFKGEESFITFQISAAYRIIEW